MEAWVHVAEGWVSAGGVWGALAAPVVMAAVAVLPLPAEAPAVMIGMVYGPLLGSALTWCGAMAGAWISYEIARRAGRPLAVRWLGERRVARTDEVVDRAGWAGLIVARLIPVVAFTALNWGAGLGGVGRLRFLWTTAVGIIPGVIVFTTSGAGLVTLYRRMPWAAALLGAALALLVLVRVRRRGVAGRVTPDPPPVGGPPPRPGEGPLP